MNNVAIYILIGLLVLVIIGVIFLGIYLIKNNKNKLNGTNKNEGIDQVSLNNLLNEQVNLITKNVNEQIADQNAKLAVYNKENAVEQVKNKEALLSEINSKFNTMNGEVVTKFGQLKEEMNSKFNDMNTQVESKFISLNEQVEKRFSKVDESVRLKLEDINKNVNTSLGDGFKTSQEHLDKVVEAVGKMNEATKNIDALNDQVVTLNSVLNNSQTRGRFGEIQLEAILSSVFGETQGIYDTQYTGKEFGDKRPDAVIFTKKEDSTTLLCIDSKFSFVEYERLFSKKSDELEDKDFTPLKTALRHQIKDISEKYILEGITYPYALMFIPNDSIYFFLQSHAVTFKDVIQYANSLNVIIVSPSMLQPILMSIKQLNINNELAKNIKLVVKQINEIRAQAELLDKRYIAAQKSLNALVNNYENLGKTITKIENKSKEMVTQSVKKGIVEQSDIALDISENEEE